MDKEKRKEAGKERKKERKNRRKKKEEALNIIIKWKRKKALNI